MITFDQLKRVVGRSRTGDQLHCSYATVRDDGSVSFGGCNSHCNNHMHLRPLNITRQGIEKREIKYRAGLFCVKCFGSQPRGEFINATISGVS